MPSAGRGNERPVVHYVDLPVYGTPMSLAWEKHRMRCIDPACAKKSWVLEDHRIAAKELLVDHGRPNGPRSNWGGAEQYEPAALGHPVHSAGFCRCEACGKSSRSEWAPGRDHGD